MVIIVDRQNGTSNWVNVANYIRFSVASVSRRGQQKVRRRPGRALSSGAKSQRRLLWNCRCRLSGEHELRPVRNRHVVINASAENGPSARFIPKATAAAEAESELAFPRRFEGTDGKKSEERELRKKGNVTVLPSFQNRRMRDDAASNRGVANNDRAFCIHAYVWRCLSDWWGRRNWVDGGNGRTRPHSSIPRSIENGSRDKCFPAASNVFSVERDDNDDAAVRAPCRGMKKKENQRIL